MPGKIPHAADQLVVPSNEGERQSGPAGVGDKVVPVALQRSYRVSQRGANQCILDTALSNRSRPPTTPSRRVPACLEAGLGLDGIDPLAYMIFPREHRTKLRSTNLIERLHAEIKRRTNVVGIFRSETPSPAWSAQCRSSRTMNGPWQGDT